MKPPQTPSIAIAGGGLIGLACALVLARRGARVTVYEAETLGRGALAASGGMLAPGLEAAEGEGAEFAAFARASLDLWDAWAEGLARFATAPLGYRRAGSLCVALTGADADWLETLAAGTDGARRLEPAAAAACEPALSAALRGAVLIDGDGELDPRALGSALAAAAEDAGAVLAPGRAVAGLIVEAGRAAGVQGPGWTARHDLVLLAAGHALRHFASELPETAAITPVKGHMLAFDGRGLTLSRIIHGARIYLTQKPDGRIVAGATTEPGRDDDAVDAGVIESLRRAAVEMVPALAARPVTESWTGIRPGTPDGRPMIGRASLPGVFIAGGHYRNGVLLAPATAELAASIMLDEAAAPAGFDPQRFHRR